MNTEELKTKLEEKRELKLLIKATLTGYNLAVEHFKKYGKFLGLR